MRVVRKTRAISAWLDIAERSQADEIAREMATACACKPWQPSFQRCQGRYPMALGFTLAAWRAAGTRAWSQLAALGATTGLRAGLAGRPHVNSSEYQRPSPL